MTICVYCSSSNRIAPAYFEVAEEMGRLLGERGLRLVYGGGRVGLMGAMARAAHEAGGTVCGIIPEALKAREGIAYGLANELITTETMQERKAGMFTRADAFVALPGGFGTLEEFMEVLTLRQLGYHDKPIALVNTGGFYDPLLAFFEHLLREHFVRNAQRELYRVVQTPEEALDHVEADATQSLRDRTS